MPASPSSRRAFLSALGAGLGAACAPAAPPPPEPVRLPLAELPDGVHRTVRLGPHPVDVVRTGAEVVARSLVCPHTGCLVRWHAPDSRYRCACHDGLFDEDGRVIGGQATKPLRRVPVRLDGDAAVIGAEPS